MIYFKSKELELTDELLIEIVSAANEVFCHGIYIPSEEGHPCGWDFISFDYIDGYEEILEYKFDITDISDGIYDVHEYENKTLKEILEATDCKFEFER